MDKLDRRYRLMGFIFVALTVLLTVYGQLVVKWQIQDTTLPPVFVDKVIFVFKQYLNPWMISALFAAFLASASWIAVLTQLDLSVAYPFTSLAFVLVLILSAMFFGEAFTLNKVAGTVVILIGLIIISR
jgi:multidrug transporter EmrE-like cation transporter